MAERKDAVPSGATQYALPKWVPDGPGAQAYDLSKTSFIHQNRGKGPSMGQRRFAQYSDPNRAEGVEPLKLHPVKPSMHVRTFTFNSKPKASHLDTEGPGPGESYGSKSSFGMQGKEQRGPALASRHRIPRNDEDECTLALDVVGSYQKSQKGPGPSAVLVGKPRQPIPDQAFSGGPQPVKIKAADRVRGNRRPGRRFDGPAPDETPGPGAYGLRDPWLGAKSKGKSRCTWGSQVNSGMSIFLDSKLAKQVLSKADQAGAGLAYFSG